MPVTALSTIATPGKPQSFSPKAPAAAEHTGLFTELSVTATPRQRHSFSAKDPATGAGTHTGLFTSLSVLALPGQRHSFSAKTEAEVVIPPDTEPLIRVSRGAGGGHGYIDRPDYEPKKDLRKRKILKGDDELMQLVAMIVASGILE